MYRANSAEQLGVLKDHLARHTGSPVRANATFSMLPVNQELSNKATASPQLLSIGGGKSNGPI